MLEFKNKEASKVHVEFGSDMISVCEEIVKLRKITDKASELLADCDQSDFSADGYFPKRARSMSELREALADAQQANNKDIK